MNIFVLDREPWRIPQHYCNLHVNKMLLETCQLLCNVFDIAPYKRTHINHPCSKWVRETMANFNWLEELGNALSFEYTKRTGKQHACDKVLDWLANNTPLHLSKGDLTPWPQCMPDKFKMGSRFIGLGLMPNFEYTIKAYRRYYASKLRDFRNRGLI